MCLDIETLFWDESQLLFYVYLDGLYMFSIYYLPNAGED